MEKIIYLPWQKTKEEPLDITLAKKAKNGEITKELLNES